jgi:hypothetical protein
MSEINYSWTVLEVNENYKVMTVQYESEGLTTYTTGMPLPTEDISLENRIKQYAPIPNWQFELMQTIPVEVGSTGTNSAFLSPQASPQDGAPVMQAPS